MVKGESSNIGIFLRIKPSPRPSPYFGFEPAKSKVRSSAWCLRSPLLSSDASQPVCVACLHL
eukprot:742414-Prorocentrum_minimum.AAC.2